MCQDLTERLTASTLQEALPLVPLATGHVYVVPRSRMSTMQQDLGSFDVIHSIMHSL